MGRIAARWGFVSLFLLVLFSVQTAQKSASGTNNAYTLSPHPYTPEFARYGISDDYKNRAVAPGLTNKEKSEVNEMIDAAQKYLLGRIDAKGIIPELSWTIEDQSGYRPEAIATLVRALLVNQESELKKDDSKKLMKSLQSAASEAEGWDFDGSVGGDYSINCGHYLLAYESLAEMENSKDAKRARQLMKKSAVHIEKRIADVWKTRTANPLFGTRLKPFQGGSGSVFAESEKLVEALTAVPDEANKLRVEIAESMLRLLVDSPLHAPTLRAARYIEKVYQAGDDLANVAKEGETKAREGKATDGDIPVAWSFLALAEKYCTTERSIKDRETFLANFDDQEFVACAGPGQHRSASLIFLSCLRYLEHPRTKRYRSKECAKLVEEAKGLVWGLILAWNFRAHGAGIDTSSAFGSSLADVSWSKGKDASSAMQVGSFAYDAARISSLLRRTVHSKYDWYAMIARKALNMRAEDGVVYARTKWDSDRSFLLNRFANNLYVLLILRKQAVEEAKPTEKGEGSEAKPTGQGKNPKAPAKTPEKPGEGKANKQD